MSSKRNQMIQALQAAEELRLRKERAPLAYFKPHAKQQLFLDNLKKHRTNIFSGGNRSGKTTANGVAIVCHLYGYWVHEAFQDGAIKLTENGDYPPRAQVPPKYWIRRLDGIILRHRVEGLAVTGLSLLKGIAQIIWPEIERWLPKAVLSQIHVTRGPMGVPLKACHPDDLWVLYMGSVEQNPMVFEGAKHDFACFDEPPSRAVHTAVWRGLTDYYGSQWFTFTPLGDHASWIYNEYIREPRENVGLVFVGQADNPFISKQAADEFVADVALSDEELAARRDGRFGFLSHRAFPTFDGSVHVINPCGIPRHWPVLLSCDPANRRPFYFVWLAWDPRRRRWIAFREFPDDRLHHLYRSSPWSIKDYATIIRNLEAGRPADARCIDPRFGPAEYTVKGEKLTSVVDDFASLGLYFDPRVPDTGRIETGIQRIRDLLHYDKLRPLSELNSPKILIFNTLKSLIFSMENYTFVPPDRRDDRVLQDKTAPLATDPIDALRYGILYGPPAKAGSAANCYIDEQTWMQTNAAEDF